MNIMTKIPFCSFVKIKKLFKIPYNNAIVVNQEKKKVGILMDGSVHNVWILNIKKFIVKEVNKLLRKK